MTIPTPWGVIIKALAWSWRQVTRALLFKTYSEAHQRWTKRNGFGARWETLGKHIEYSLYLTKPTDAEPRVSKIAFRAVDAAVVRFDCIFEAAGAGLRYQDAITAHDLDRSPVVFPLTRVPSQNFLSHLKGDIRFTLESYQFRKCSVSLEGGQVPEFDSLTWHLGHNWLISDTWNRRWGTFWNCNSITYAKREIEIYWKWGFATGGRSVYTPLPRRGHSKRLFWNFWRIAVVWLMSRPWMLTVQFWAAIWSRQFVLDESDRLRRR